jgi:hypothetical protein
LCAGERVWISLDKIDEEIRLPEATPEWRVLTFSYGVPFRTYRFFPDIMIRARFKETLLPEYVGEMDLR